MVTAGIAGAAIGHAVTPPHAPSPNILSIRLLNEDTAHDMWRESLSLGEKTCLTEMSDGELRYWLHSCAQPHFTNSHRDAGGTVTYHYGEPK